MIAGTQYLGLPSPKPTTCCGRGGGRFAATDRQEEAFVSVVPSLSARRPRPPSCRRRCRLTSSSATAPASPSTPPRSARRIARAGAATGEFDAAEAQRLAASVGRGARAPLRRRRARHRADPGRRRAGADRRRPPQDRARLHRLPRAAHASCARTARRVVDVESSINEYLDQHGLARQRQRQPGLLAGRPDPQRLGQGGRQLLAQPRLPAGSRRGAPRGRHPHPRSRHAGRLLRRLVAAHAAARRPQRRAGQGRGRPAQAHVERGRPDRQLPRHAAERMGRRAGVQLVRHLHGAVHPQGQPDLRRRCSSASRS